MLSKNDKVYLVGGNDRAADDSRLSRLHEWGELDPGCFRVERNGVQEFLRLRPLLVTQRLHRLVAHHVSHESLIQLIREVMGGVLGQDDNSNEASSQCPRPMDCRDAGGIGIHGWGEKEEDALHGFTISRPSHGQ